MGHNLENMRVKEQVAAHQKSFYAAMNACVFESICVPSIHSFL